MGGTMSDVTEGAEGTPSDVVSERVLSWVDEQAESLEAFIRLVELQHEQPQRFFDAIDASRHETQRAVLTALVKGDGATDYDGIERHTNRSRRSIRKHVANLEESNLVDRVDSQYYAITFTDDEAQALAQHALTLYYNQPV